MSSPPNPSALQPSALKSPLLRTITSPDLRQLTQNISIAQDTRNSSSSEALVPEILPLSLPKAQWSPSVPSFKQTRSHSWPPAISVTHFGPLPRYDRQKIHAVPSSTGVQQAVVESPAGVESSRELIARDHAWSQIVIPTKESLDNWPIGGEEFIPLRRRGSSTSLKSDSGSSLRPSLVARKEGFREKLRRRWGQFIYKPNDKSAKQHSTRDSARISEASSPAQESQNPVTTEGTMKAFTAELKASVGRHESSTKKATSKATTSPSPSREGKTKNQQRPPIPKRGQSSGKKGGVRHPPHELSAWRPVFTSTGALEFPGEQPLWESHGKHHKYERTPSGQRHQWKPPAKYIFTVREEPQGSSREDLTIGVGTTTQKQDLQQNDVDDRDSRRGRPRARRNSFIGALKGSTSS